MGVPEPEVRQTPNVNAHEETD